MNKLILVLAVSALVWSCNSSDSAAAKVNDTTAAAPEKSVNFLYPSHYPSDWKIGDPQNIVKVQEIYRIMLSDSNYEAILPYLADTVHNVQFDNKKINLSAQEFVNAVKELRSGFTTLNEDFRSYVSLRSDSQEMDMVMLWIKEKGVRKNGKVDSSGYQETWRFNKEGKIDYHSTFVRYDF